jgi:hypothetical protein
MRQLRSAFMTTLGRSLALGAIAIASGWLGILISDHDVPISYQSMRPVEPEVRPGGLLRITHDAVRFRSCATKINRLIFDSENKRFVVPDLDFPYATLPVGPDTFLVAIRISPEASEGEATYRVLRTYICNFTHRLWPIRDGPYDMKFTIRGEPLREPA